MSYLQDDQLLLWVKKTGSFTPSAESHFMEIVFIRCKKCGALVHVLDENKHLDYHRLNDVDYGVEEE